MDAQRHRQLAEDRRVLERLRNGPMTFDEIASPAALSRLVQAGAVKVAGFRRAKGRGQEEPALFGLVEKGE